MRTRKVHLNYLMSVDSSPYRKGKVCHSMMSTMTKMNPVTTIWIGYLWIDVR